MVQHDELDPFLVTLRFLGGSEPCVAFLGSSVKWVTDPSDLCSVS